MSYFDKFPDIAYGITAGADPRLVKDVLRRVSIKDSVINNGDIFFEYAIKDTDRPDIIAEKLYGRSDLHWIILLTNEIHNVYTEWPMPEATLNDYISQEYPGTTLFLDPTDSASFSTIAPTESRFVKGKVIHGVESGATGIVLEYDPTYARLVVTDVHGSFEPDESVTSDNLSGKEFSASLGRVVLFSPEAVHHFEDADGQWLDPMGRTIDERDTEVDYLASYINSSIDSFVVTNREHESHLNDQRRTIKLLRPVVVDKIVKDFNSVFNVRR